MRASDGCERALDPHLRFMWTSDLNRIFVEGSWFFPYDPNEINSPMKLFVNIAEIRREMEDTLSPLAWCCWTLDFAKDGTRILVVSYGKQKSN